MTFVGSLSVRVASKSMLPVLAMRRVGVSCVPARAEATPARDTPKAGGIHSFLSMALCANKTPRLRGNASTESARSNRLSLSRVVMGS